MSQLLLPLISEDIVQINSQLIVFKDNNRWAYFLGQYKIYDHAPSDERMFKLITSQLIESKICRQIEIIKTFGIPKSTVIRDLNKLRKGGSEAFFKARRGRKGGTILKQDVLEKAQKFLDERIGRRAITEKLGIKYDTLRKAINDGRLQENNKDQSATNKSTRTKTDAIAADGMGTACTRVDERTFAAFGVSNGATVNFEPCLDVPMGGVLCALPALLSNGLLNGVGQFLGDLKGYYTKFQVLLLLGFMALCRIKTVEKVRGHSPGEFGKLLGLDRIPEVRCLREKLDDLSSGTSAEQWAAHLSKLWMDANVEAAGTLYIDGHVRVYHGGLTKPPRRYVSRERLCLRGTTDYWVNDGTGLPFFVVEKTVDPGLLKTLQEDIVPRLLEDIPNQPTEQELEENPLACRFILVFDREGYSPPFFRKMWEKHRIGCMTYHKFPSKNWPEDWFVTQDVKMPNGEIVTMKLTEMGSLVGSGKDRMWMREVRRLNKSGHQTSLVSTVYELPHAQLGGRMFSRWCQENFFRYMMEHFDIDLLREYGVEKLPDTETVMNPIWRSLNKTRTSVKNKLNYRQRKFAKMTLHPETAEKPVKYEKWLREKASLLEEIAQFERQLDELKADIKEVPQKIMWQELKDEDKFYRFHPGRKRLMDTVSLIAYRAETAMANLLKSPTVDSAAARRLLQVLYVTEADILPQPEINSLKVRVHNASRPAANAVLEKLIKELNATEVLFPGTDMRMIYELISQGSKSEPDVEKVPNNLPRDKES